jgi:hypothetical protein
VVEPVRRAGARDLAGDPEFLVDATSGRVH